jgi:hypothetical protein
MDPVAETPHKVSSVHRLNPCDQDFCQSMTYLRRRSKYCSKYSFLPKQVKLFSVTFLSYTVLAKGTRPDGWKGLVNKLFPTACLCQRHLTFPTHTLFHPRFLPHTANIEAIHYAAGASPKFKWSTGNWTFTIVQIFQYSKSSIPRSNKSLLPTHQLFRLYFHKIRGIHRCRLAATCVRCLDYIVSLAQKYNAYER